VVIDPADQSDLQLWARAKAGDESAFGDLFERHASRIFNYCFRRLGSWSIADDATSRTFTTAWQRRHVVEVNDSLLPWLFTVANNVCRNLARAARRYSDHLSTLPESLAVTDHADDVASRVDDERRMQAVLVALRRLRRADRDVLILCDWEDLSYLETADALGIPIGTVRSRLSRARQRLRTALGEDGSPASEKDANQIVDEPRGELS
jgi:RNA polymerase sigma factor (sigma-70 family)